MARARIITAAGIITSSDAITSADPIIMRGVMRLPVWFLLPDDDYFNTFKHHAFDEREDKIIRWYSDYLDVREVRKRQRERYSYKERKDYRKRYERRNTRYAKNYIYFPRKEEMDMIWKRRGGVQAFLTEWTNLRGHATST